MISLRIVSLKEKKKNENSKSESFFDLDDVVQKVLLFVVCSRLLFAARRNITFDREHSLRMPWIEVLTLPFLSPICKYQRIFRLLHVT